MINFEEIESFTIFEDGEEVTCQVLTDFEVEENGCHYLVFTKGEVDEDGQLLVETSRVDPEAEELELLAITDPEEKEMIGQLLDEILEIEIEEVDEEDEEEDEE